MSNETATVTEIQVEHGIAVPKSARKLHYPFDNMGAGDSFFIAAESEEEQKNIQRRATASWMGAIKKGRLAGKFTSRRVEGGVRVWRVE